MGQADALAAVLAGCDLRDDLCGNVAGRGEGVRLFNQSAADDRAVLQHIVQIDEVAVVHVLGVVVGIVEVDDALLMRLDDLRGEQHAHGQILADLAGHVVTLYAVDGRVLVGVLLLDFLVVALDEGEDLVVRRVMGALEALHVAIGDVPAGNLIRAGGHDGILDDVLDLLDVHRVAAGIADLLHMIADLDDLLLRQALGIGYDLVSLRDGRNNFGNVKDSLAAVALDDLHGDSSLQKNKYSAFNTNCIECR